MPTIRAKCKSMCTGCRNDFYNINREGGCWSYKSAEVVTRAQVGTWQNPPYRWRPRRTLSCHRPEGLSWVQEDDCRVVDDTDEAVAAYHRKYEVPNG